MANGSLKRPFDIHVRDFGYEPSETAFRNFRECQRRLENMEAGKASTPASRDDSRGLVPQGEGGTVVRNPQGQVHQAWPHFLYLRY